MDRAESVDGNRWREGQGERKKDGGEVRRRWWIWKQGREEDAKEKQADKKDGEADRMEETKERELLV